MSLHFEVLSPGIRGPCCVGSRKHKRRRRGGATPLPIPNREVKPACADGTARKGGRAGGCRLWGATTDRSMVTSCRRRPFLFCAPSPFPFPFPFPGLPSSLPVPLPDPKRSSRLPVACEPSRPSLRPRKPEANARVASACFLDGKSTADPLGTLCKACQCAFYMEKARFSSKNDKNVGGSLSQMF